MFYFYMHLNQETTILDKKVRSNSEGEYINLVNGWTYYEYNETTQKELIILIHGGGIAGTHVWKKTKYHLLEDGFDVLSYDLFGRGYSDRPQIKYSPEMLLGQFEELLDSLNIDRHFHVISLSLGAMIAVDYANKNPDKVKSLIFIDPILQGNYRPSPLLNIPILSNFIMTTYWYPRAVENQRKEFVNMESFEEYAIHLNYFMNFKGYKYVNYSTWMHTLQIDYIPDLTKLGKKAVEMLLIYGQQDPYFPKKGIEIYSKAAPNMRYIEIPQTGHMPHYEKPEKVNKEINNFLNAN